MRLRISFCLLLPIFSVAAPAETVALDISKAAVVVADADPLVRKAADMLTDEIAERTGLRLRRSDRLRDLDGPRIVLGTSRSLSQPHFRDLLPPETKDGYAAFVSARRKTTEILLVGHDSRGTLYAAGRLLRSLDMRPQHLTIDSSFKEVSAPRYPLRGHQLGYRSTNNSCDRWDLRQYEQYIRDLVVFGTNAIELTPPLEPATKQSEMMQQSPWEMNPKLAELIASYGLDVWFWLPVRADVSNLEEAERELSRQRALLARFSRVDAVFVPGGDPGDTPPEILLPFLEQMAGSMKLVHPKATLWLSNQGFDDARNDYLFNYLHEKQPDWLAGLVFGPWTHIALPEMRKRTPEKYFIRRYPDIGHCVRCQYPVPQWDRAFARTLGREPFNPRPMDFAHIHNSLAPFSDGFISYSDGVNDDVNKMLWSALGCDPEAGVEGVLEDYGRYFFGGEQAEDVARGILMLERNWKNAASDSGVEETFLHWQRLEKGLAPQLEKNWRLQLCLLRAYYDEYLRRRVIDETRRETASLQALSGFAQAGPSALEAARKALGTPQQDAGPWEPLRPRIEELGKRLFESVGMQLDTDRYGALTPERGAVLCFLDTPLNDRAWLEKQFEAIRQEKEPQRQRALVDAVLNWSNPGPGGFYDDLGSRGRDPRLVRDVDWEDDPGFIESPQNEFSGNQAGWRLSWNDQGQTLYATPLRMRYTDLKPGAQYRLAVVYTGRFKAKMRLTAEGKEIHGPLGAVDPVAPQEFDVPRAATQDGTLELQWECVEGRGCQVAEVWLREAR